MNEVGTTELGMTGREHSLGRQLAVGISLGVALFWLLAMAGAAYVIRHELEEVFDSVLQETAERILPLAVLELFDREDSAAVRLAQATEHDEFLTYVIRDNTGQVLMQSHKADLSLFDGDLRDGFRQTANARIFSRSAISGTYQIEVAEPLGHRRQAVKETLIALLWPLIVLVPIGLAGILWFVRRAMRPVKRLRNEVTLRDGHDLRPVRIDGLPQELTEVARAINHLMGRVRRTLEAERSFTANSAHELRTPIAAGLAQTQRLIAELTPGPTKDRAYRVEAELHRLTRLSEKLMQLAKAEGGAVLQETAQDLRPILNAVVDEFARHGHAARLQLALPKTPALSRMDPDAFGILARNLIENALRHGDPGGTVFVELQADGLVVRNGGKVIPADRLAALSGRFIRGETKGEGSGLGLAISKTIAEAAGGGLVLSSPATGQTDGFEARVTFPPLG